MTIIRSFYFRNEDEVAAVKNFIAQLRGKTPQVVSESAQIIPKDRLFRAPTAQKVGISVEEFLAKHPVKNQEPPQKTEVLTPVDDLPSWLYAVMTGSFPPPPEENTAAQNKMFADKEFQAVCKEYEKSHDPELIKVARDIAERCGVEL